jgi:hypothetical protein
MPFNAKEVDSLKIFHFALKVAKFSVINAMESFT